MADPQARPLSADVAKHAHDHQACIDLGFGNENNPIAPLHSPSTTSQSVINKVTSLYVAGPMRGLPNHGYPIFNAVTKHLRDQGYTVRNPAENFGGDETRELAEYMALDLQMVMDTDGIVLLPGWRDSEFGRIEASMAKALSRQFYQAVLMSADDNLKLDPSLPDSWMISKMPTPSTTGAEGIDAEARALVYGARNSSYGNPAADFSCTGRKWAATLSAYTNTRIEDIPPEIVSVMLMDLKTARLGHNPAHRDSRVDVIGYALCHDRIIENR